MKKQAAVFIMVCLVILSGWEVAEAADHFYVNFSIVLGGVAAGAAGIYFFLGAQGEISQAPLPLAMGLLNLEQSQVRWNVPELVIRTADSSLVGPQGIEGYACLLRVRFR